MGNFEKLGILVIIILVVVIMVLTIWGGPVPDGEPDPIADPNALSSQAGGSEPEASLASRPHEPPFVQPDFAPPDEPVDEPETVKHEPPAVPARLEDIEHVVRKGEVLYRIAESYYGNGKYYQEIADANPTVNARTLAPGTKLRIPHPDKVLLAESRPTPEPAESAESPDSYVVKKGDSLSKISKKVYGNEGRWKKIWEANRDVIGDDPARLRPEMRLRIPR